MSEADRFLDDPTGWRHDATASAGPATAPVLPPPAGAPSFRPVWGSDAPLAPGQVLAAPSTARLRHLPPPQAVADAVPLDLDALEHAARHARDRQPDVTVPAEPTMAGLRPPDPPRPTAPFRTRGLAAPTRPDGGEAMRPAGAPVIPPDATPADLDDPERALAALRSPVAPPVAAPVAPPVEHPSTADLLTPLVTEAPAPVAPTAPTPVRPMATPPAPATPRSTGVPVGTTPDRTRDPVVVAVAPAGVRNRRPGLLVGSVAAFAAVAIGTAALAQQRRDDPAPVAASVTTPAATVAAGTVPAITAPATTGAPAATAAPATTAPAVTAPAPTTSPAPEPATSAPEPPATTAAVEPAPVTTSAPATVLGTFVLNREVLDSLGKGALPGGQPWPRVTFTEGRMVVGGTVPSQTDALAVMRAAATLAPTPDVLVNQLTIDPTVPPVRYLLVQLFDNPIFDRGATAVRRDSEAVFELWGKRLREEPGRTLVLVAHGDGTGTSLASTRAKNALARLLATGGVAPEQVEAQWAAGAATGPRLSFAIPIN